MSGTNYVPDSIRDKCLWIQILHDTENVMVVII